MSIRTNKRRLLATTVVALACAASTASNAAAEWPAQGGGSPQAIPPILPAPTAAEQRAIRRAEALESARFAYRLPVGARYSSAEMDVFATEGSSVLELPVWHR
jgi:hypothetical protein